MNIETDEMTYGSSDSPLHLSRANYSVVRVKRNVFGYSSVGAIFLNREGGAGAAFNRTAGVDLNLVLGKTTTLTALAARTFTPGSKGDDYAAGFDFAYQKDRYNYGLTYLDVGPSFDAGMGYIQRADIRNPRVRAAWTPRPRWPGVRQLGFGASVDTFATHAGQLVSRTDDGQFIAAFNDTSILTVDVLHDDDRLTSLWQLGNGVVPMGDHRWNTLSLSYLSNSSLPVAGTAGVQTGSYYSGDKTTMSAGLNLLPLVRLLVETSYSRNRITLPAFPIYVTNTVSTRVSYSLSPSLFAKGFIQYNDAKKQATVNLLLWYIYRSGSDFYVVYNEGWDTDLPGPHVVQPRSRSLSVKLTSWLSR
jgi:hypothetical protein